MPSDVIIATIGHCIYCGAAGPDVELTAEHIVPYALDGFYVLANASCIACSDITKHIEQNVLRPMLGLTRARMGMQTRRPAARNKPFRVEVHEHATVSIHHVSHCDLPAFLWLPVFAVPGLPFGDTPQEELPLLAWWYASLDKDPQEMLKRLGKRLGSSGEVVLGVLRLDEFARMLAKIAHAAAVALPSLGQFRPLLPDIILRKNLDLSLYVGCSNPHHIAPPESNLIRVMVCWAKKPFDQWLIAEIRLFAMLGAPSYQVIVGTRV
jgi:hypothetical protein